MTQIEREQRNARMTQLHAAGATFVAIAKRFGLNATTVRYAVQWHQSGEFAGLSVRADNALFAAGILTREQLLREWNPSEFLKEPNVGRATVAEVQAWIDRARAA